MELGPEDVFLLERCPHFRGWYVQLSYSWDLMMCTNGTQFRRRHV